MRLNFLTTSTSLTVWFEKPEDTDGETTYTISLNGTTTEVHRTHHTFVSLTPETEYTVEVLMGEQFLGSGTCSTRSISVRHNVREYGATGDGTTMDTEALQAALDACGKNEEVVLPPGIYCTGALRLHSDMSLYLEAGAVLKGTACPKDYLPRIPSRFEGIEGECYSSLLNLGTLDHNSGPTSGNVLIYGHGTIESGGQELALAVIEQERERLKTYLEEHQELVESCENDNTIPGRVRPRLINLSNTENVRISGLTLKNGACWNVHMIYSDSIVTDHCTFISEGVWNGDGWDPDSSENCAVFACRFETGDDAVAIKSGKNPEGNQINRPTRHIHVFDCVSTFGHGIAIGSEISGGVEDVKIYDCDFETSGFGVLIKGTPKRGGYVRDIEVSDCKLPRIIAHSVPYNDDGIPAPTAPIFERFRFERLTLSGIAHTIEGEVLEVPPIELEGFDIPGHALKDAVIRDCHITGSIKEPVLRNCENITIENLTTE